MWNLFDIITVNWYSNVMLIYIFHLIKFKIINLVYFLHLCSCIYLPYDQISNLNNYKLTSFLQFIEFVRTLIKTVCVLV